ncbi:hypothetical protein ATY41_06560 [Leifsonia xyli subsp. xyli]|uniref:Uncharacterized protein n=1 Tax=Leifsonia xyli subsp. xyli TaxID=59736 RepID=A0A1E2SMH4_LEIXY|nr:hypothetical protein [Leifsonia xyli]ODA91055.1 hypothetical protein ATY41_06560 [Leifsonia xyli subsp. xyli]
MPSPTAHIRQRAVSAKDVVGDQSEWFTVGGINSEQILWGMSMEKYYDEFPLLEEDFPSEYAWLEHLYSDDDKEFNGSFDDPEGIASSEPYAITEVSFGEGVSCSPVLTRSGPARARSALASGHCGRLPTNEEELSGIHRENLSGDSAEIRFVVRDEQVADAAGRLLTPLPSANKLLRDFHAEQGVAGLRELAPALDKALQGDLALVEKVSSHSQTVLKSLKAVGKQASRSSELLPYVAIAATGYALSEDIASGNWVDAGFDGAAIGLIAVGTIQPELLVVTEPALLVLIAAQWVVDKYRADHAPPPVMSAWQRANAQRDFELWQKLPSTLAQLRLGATKDQIVSATETVMGERIVPAMRARFAADKLALRKMHATYMREAHRLAVKAAGGAFTGPAWEKVRPHEEQMLRVISRAFRAQWDTRQAAYAKALGEQVQAVADRFAADFVPGSTPFEHIRLTLDAAVASPAVQAAESLMNQYSRYQNAPIAYPDRDDLAFRSRLQQEKLTAYEAEFARIGASVGVVVPNDDAENHRLLSGEPSAKVLVHLPSWGDSVPGGVTSEITIKDPRRSVSGAMTITAPDGSTIESIRTSLENQPAIVVSADKTTATVGASGEPILFGGAGAGVLVRLKSPRSAVPGSTIGGGGFSIEAAGAVAARGSLDIVVRDTIPAAHGFAESGRVTNEVAIDDPRATAVGTMTVTAPTGTRIDSIRVSDSTTVHLSDDRRSATIDGAFGGGKVTVLIRFHVVDSSKRDALLADGRVVVAAGGVPVASGPIIVSTYPVTVSQTSVPALRLGQNGSATVRIENHAQSGASGIDIEFTAPSGSVFASPDLTWRNSTLSGGTNTGKLSADKRTLTYSSAEFTVNATSWVDLSTELTAQTSGGGLLADGVFRIAPGKIVPDGAKTALAYKAVIAELPHTRGQAGPGGTFSFVVYDAATAVTGTMTLDAPRGMTFKSVQSGYATVTYRDDRRQATISRNTFGGTGYRLPITVAFDADARPTRTYSGQLTIADGGATVAVGTFDVLATIEGCLHQGTYWVPWGLLTTFRVAHIRNSCRADIAVKVPFSGGPDSGWKTIGYREEAEFWSTPWAAPQDHVVGPIRPNP